jgi:hypothetical protein
MAAGAFFAREHSAATLRISRRFGSSLHADGEKDPAEQDYREQLHRSHCVATSV